MNKFRAYCYKRGYEVYGKYFFGVIRARLDCELSRIEDIPGGAGTILAVAEYMTKVKNLYRSMRNRDLWYTFRGPASSGLVAYLLGITLCNPVELGFYPWPFLMKRSKIDFFINMSTDACRILSEQDMYLPSGLTLFADGELTELEKFCGTNMVHLGNPMERGVVYDSVINDYFRLYKESNDLTLLTGFDSFDDKFNPEVCEIFQFLRQTDLLPRNLSQLMKLNGFLHCKYKETSHFAVLKSLAKDGECVYEKLVSCPEDVYEELVKNGCGTFAAEELSKMVQRNGQNLKTEDLLKMVEFCGEDVFEQSQNIDHLFFRSQIYEKSCVTAALMEVGLHKTERAKGGAMYGYQRSSLQ